ncbi:uncharacterized protein LOC123548740 [Mercenaria mercenaria]|uniref:uncharacterized protein LOC123548740 n=1 Tax=Mercenaria mercenaria TaxID=6596 RepID=UPI00234F5A1A|nr:uncharacterized protein LOC123548740 [Mercenaria mercenaria]
MRKGLFVLFIIMLWIRSGTSQTASTTTIRCRLCNNAFTLSDCNKLVTCDSTLEECYMDEVITEQRMVVYQGGCRAKDVCSRSGKRNSKTTCSSCCGFEDDCNKRLCGIKDDTVNISQCYSCDHRRSDRPCLTLTSCHSNEMCYMRQEDVGGVDRFTSGCLSKLVCEHLMKRAYDFFRICGANSTLPEAGLTWVQVCGNRNNKRATALCTSCCADQACNYGTCHELNRRLFYLAENGKFDINTLKVV